MSASNTVRLCDNVAMKLPFCVTSFVAVSATAARISARSCRSAAHEAARFARNSCADVPWVTAVEATSMARPHN